MVKIREVWSESKWWQELSLGVLDRLVPQWMIQEALAEAQLRTVRVRKLNLEVIVLWVIAMNLYTERPIDGVFEALARGIDWIGPDEVERLPGGSALVWRRYQLGARPMVSLFHRVCRPLATPQTVGAFRFGLRLMAIDGTVEDVADTKENEAAFGRMGTDRGVAAFPQVRCVYLSECGTHSIVDAGVWPCHTSERVGAFRLLRSVGPGMLIEWDRGFHDYELFRSVKRRGAHGLARLPANVLTPVHQRLKDGSYLTYLYPSDPKRRRAGERLLVRVVEYTLTDPQRPGYREKHRLVTTLLDPEVAPAVELAGAYHERWEIELVIDEIDTHQRLAGRPLRSKKPVGVIQELYGLLIAHYLVRSLMHEAALAAEIDPDRLSFTGALRAVKDMLPFIFVVDPESTGLLFQRLLRKIADARLPERRNRIQPRVVKRKMSKFLLKRHQHRRWPKLTTPFPDAIALI